MTRSLTIRAQNEAFVALFLCLSGAAAGCRPEAVPGAPVGEPSWYSAGTGAQTAPLAGGNSVSAGTYAAPVTLAPVAVQTTGLGVGGSPSAAAAAGSWAATAGRAASAVTAGTGAAGSAAAGSGGSGTSPGQPSLQDFLNSVVSGLQTTLAQIAPSSSTAPAATPTSTSTAGTYGGGAVPSTAVAPTPPAAAAAGSGGSAGSSASAGPCFLGTRNDAGVCEL